MSLAGQRIVERLAVSPHQQADTEQGGGQLGKHGADALDHSLDAGLLVAVVAIRGEIALQQREAEKAFFLGRSTLQAAVVKLVAETVDVAVQAGEVVGVHGTAVDAQVEQVVAEGVELLDLVGKHVCESFKVKFHCRGPCSTSGRCGS